MSSLSTFREDRLMKFSYHILSNIMNQQQDHEQESGKEMNNFVAIKDKQCGNFFGFTNDLLIGIVILKNRNFSHHLISKHLTSVSYNATEKGRRLLLMLN
jgi:hypothetical protein